MPIFVEHDDIPIVCDRLDVSGQFNMKFDETENPHQTTRLSEFDQNKLFEVPENHGLYEGAVVL